MLKGLIVDDENRGQRILSTLCKDYCEDLNIIGTASSVSSATEMVDTHQPDLVFLDIEMPLENGFELLEKYKDNPPFEFIFTTAYEKYALKALKTAAIDYLLKPIEIDSLVQAVRKAKRKISEEKERLVQADLSTNQDKIALTTTEGFNFVKFDEIIRCEAQGNYTNVFLTDGSSLLITKTLKHYEQLLEPKYFFRVHKSHLINLRFIRKFIKGKRSYVETLNGETIEVSARKRDSLLKRLSDQSPD